MNYNKILVGSISGDEAIEAKPEEGVEERLEVPQQSNDLNPSMTWPLTTTHDMATSNTNP